MSGIKEFIKEYSINQIKPHPRNPRIHPDSAIEKLQRSIQEFGFVNPVLLSRDGILLAGHARLKASKAEGREHVPALILDLDGEKGDAYLIADNKLQEETEWDLPILKDLLQELDTGEFDIEITGFELPEIEDLMTQFYDDSDELGAEDDDFDPDEALEDIDEPITKFGDIWILGEHRLMCGDSTNKEDVKALMNGTKADMTFTDPPYNIDYGNIKHPKFKVRNIENDNMSKDEFRKFCEKFILNIKEFTTGCVYMAGPPGPDGRIMFTQADNLLHCSTTIIWNKDVFTLGRGKYQNKYEPIWFGWVESGRSFTEDRNLTNVWDIARPKKSELHPTMKPIELVATAINHNPSAKTILDLFGGSGSTLMAAEQTNKTAYLMELDEKYCDIIIRRWEEYTGEKAVRENGQEIEVNS